MASWHGWLFLSVLVLAVLIMALRSFGKGNQR